MDIVDLLLELWGLLLWRCHILPLFRDKPGKVGYGMASFLEIQSELWHGIANDRRSLFVVVENENT